MNSFWENHKEFIKNKRLILKTQQRFRSKKDNVFTEETSNTALSANDDKRIKSANSVETCICIWNKQIFDIKKRLM